MNALRQVTTWPFFAVSITLVARVAKASAAPVLRIIAIMPPARVTSTSMEALPLMEGIT